MHKAEREQQMHSGKEPWPCEHSFWTEAKETLANQPNVWVQPFHEFCCIKGTCLMELVLVIATAHSPQCVALDIV